MQKALLVAALGIGLVMLFGSWTVAGADGKSDFALFDGTAPVETAGAACGSGKPKDVQDGKEFTYHVSVTNYGTAGFVRIRYADGDVVDYKIPVDGTLNLTGAAGSKAGADRAVRVCGVGGSVLVGQMSALGNQPWCVSCEGTNAFAGGNTCADQIEALSGAVGSFTCP